FALLPGGDLYVALTDKGGIGVYNWRTGQEERQLSVPVQDHSLQSPLRVTPNGRQLLFWGCNSKQEHCLIAWDLVRDRELWRTGWENLGMAPQFSLSSDGSRLLEYPVGGGTIDWSYHLGMVRIRDTTTGKVVKDLQGQNSKSVFRGLFFPDGHQVWV